jgi:hypothetical protein
MENVFYLVYVDSDVTVAGFEVLRDSWSERQPIARVIIRIPASYLTAVWQTLRSSGTLGSLYLAFEVGYILI